MRNALLDDLRSLQGVQVLLMQDARLSQHDVEINIAREIIMISVQTDLQALLLTRQADYDAVWLIAPETDGILAFWCQYFSAQGKYLYTSGQAAVSLCQDKLATTRLLQSAGIACVLSRVYAQFDDYKEGSWVIKVNDSVGCDQVYLVQSEQDWRRVAATLSEDKTYIIQPYISGKSLSLSCLFYQGKAYYICCNQQHTYVVQQQFVLSACTVNIQSNHKSEYQQFCQQIAAALPQLFGYVGIDLIVSGAGESLILEINPRLTTSYAGIKQALGINIAELVLSLPYTQVQLNTTRNQQVRVDIAPQGAYAS